jgi:hypothetical protein
VATAIGFLEQSTILYLRTDSVEPCLQAYEDWWWNMSSNEQNI